MEEFRCECAQTVPAFAVLSTATEWAVFRAMFHLAENERTIRVAWQDKGWATVETARDWDDKVRGQVARQPPPEDNGAFPRRLVVEIKDRVGGW